MTRSSGISAVVLTSPVRSVAPSGRRAAAKEGAVEERDGEADFRAEFDCNTMSEQCKSRSCSQNIAGGRETLFPIISLRPQLSQIELDLDGPHLVMQNNNMRRA